jgi:hypothetical protein
MSTERTHEASGLAAELAHGSKQGPGIRTDAQTEELLVPASGLSREGLAVEQKPASRRDSWFERRHSAAYS